MTSTDSIDGPSHPTDLQGAAARIAAGVAEGIYDTYSVERWTQAVDRFFTGLELNSHPELADRVAGRIVDAIGPTIYSDGAPDLYTPAPHLARQRFLELSEARNIEELTAFLTD